MSYRWDEKKRLSNLQKHGIDFLDVAAAFGDPDGFDFPSVRSAVESRLVRVGKANGRIIAVVYTERGDVVRIITARIARRSERQLYGREND